MRKPFLIILVAGLLLRLAIAWLPISVLITRTMPDDAFIYFVIARNISAGLGATFDGLMPTNGFHPLWAVLIGPIFRLTVNSDLPVHLALSLSALCDVAAGALGAITVSRLVGKDTYAPLLTFGFYAFNPRAIQESVNGLETGLAMLALAGCVFVWTMVVTGPESRGRAAALGAVAGITFLARSDFAIIIGLLLTVLLLKRRWQETFTTVAVAAGFVAPWFVWSLLRIGTVVQSSGVAIPSLAAYRIETSTDFGQLWTAFLLPILNYSFRYSLIYPGAAMLAVLIGLVFLRWPNSPRVGNNAMVPVLLWVPFVGAFAIVAVHTLVRWYPRGWYFVPLAWAFALVAGPLLARALVTPIGTRHGRWVLVLLGLVIAGQAGRMINEPDYSSQADMLAGAEWLKANTAPGEIIGAFNAGIYAYYSGRTVLNLDGLVDWGVIEARQENRLLDYFVARGGTLVIDHEAYALGSFSPFFGARQLQPLSRLTMTDAQYGPITIYRVQ